MITVLGWKEYELELLRDDNDNVIIICSMRILIQWEFILNSITVAPCMTLLILVIKEYEIWPLKMMRSIGDFAKGCNVQFAVSPDENEDIMAVEINPRVSRSSVQAKTLVQSLKLLVLLIGYTLDELNNQITKNTSICLGSTFRLCCC